MTEEAFHFGTVGKPKSTPAKPGGSVGAIQHLASQGLLAFELGWVRSVRVSESTCERIRQAAQDAGVLLSVHAPYYINLNADDQEWPKSRKRLLEAAHFGNLAGASDIVFHPGSYFGKGREEVLGIALRRLRGCVEELRSTGNRVNLRPETMGKGALIGSLEDTLTLAREIEGVDPCLDFAHLHARAGDGSLNSFEEWNQVFAQIRRTLGQKGLRTLHCHLSGIEYGERGERRHLMIRESDLDLDGLLVALAENQCAGRILCESPERMDEDALLIKSAWERIGASAV